MASITPPKTFSLPTEKSTPSDSLSDYSILLYGVKKGGKTTTAAHFPKALFLSTEPGTKALEVFSVEVGNWADFVGYIKALEKAPAGQYGTIIVDTVDLAYEYCFQSVCKAEGIEHPGDLGYGKGWNKVLTTFRNAVLRLFHLPGNPGIVFISHDTEKEFEDREGKKFDRIQPTMAKQALGVIEALVDIIVSYQYEKGKRVAKICGSDWIVAGCRLQEHGRHFIAKDGSPVETIPMGNSSQEAYQNFVAAFNNEQETADGEETPAPKIAKTKTLPASTGRKIRFG